MCVCVWGGGGGNENTTLNAACFSYSSEILTLQYRQVRNNCWPQIAHKHMGIVSKFSQWHIRRLEDNQTSSSAMANGTMNAVIRPTAANPKVISWLAGNWEQIPQSTVSKYTAIVKKPNTSDTAMQLTLTVRSMHNCNGILGFNVPLDRSFRRWGPWAVMYISH